MTEKEPPNADPLEEAIRAFQAMTVCERPADAELLARFGSRPSGLPPSSGIPVAPKKTYRWHLILASTAAAVLVFGGLALFLRHGAPPHSVQETATPLPLANKLTDERRHDHLTLSAPLADAARADSLKAERTRLSLREEIGTLEQQVAAAQVVAVATALDSAPAPPSRPGDLAEVLLRFQVKRVLKGKLADKIITIRTPTAADELIGKDWVVFLSPTFLAGKHPYARCVTGAIEPAVKTILAKDKK